MPVFVSFFCFGCDYSYLPESYVLAGTIYLHIGLVTEHSVPMHHAFGILKLPDNWKHCYFERSLTDYMDHDNCPMTLKRFWTL